MAEVRKIDAVTTEIIRNGMVAATEEMKSNLMRTAYNMIIYEALDFTVGLFDRQGQTLSLGLGLPMFIRGMSDVVKAKIDHWGLENIHPGDILLTNDAYITGAHLNHLTFSIPIFHQGEIVAFSTCMAHWQDIGGILNGVTTDIYAEGLQIPLVKYHRQGVLNEEMRDLILMNVRRRDRAAGDLEAQLSACRVGVKHLEEMLSRHGESAWQWAINAIMDHTEAEAREIADYREKASKDKRAAVGAATTMEQLMAKAKADLTVAELPIIVKADVQGSAEAIVQALEKIGNDEVRVRVLHSAVGQITESDIQLAKASDAVIVAFNVRATSQARDLAQREGVEIRYYSIIYEVADDIEKLVKGKLAPVQREKFLGYAQILQVFEVKRIGKVAGCRITEGQVKRGAGVRLLRDGVVIHQGELSTLRRFKDDVREVGNGLECGMSFANYDDIRVGDQIECYETETVAG